MTNGLRPFQERGKWGYKNQKGQVVIPPLFDEAGKFFNGIAQVKLCHKVD